MTILKVKENQSCPWRCRADRTISPATADNSGSSASLGVPRLAFGIFCYHKTFHFIFVLFKCIYQDYYAEKKLAKHRLSSGRQQQYVPKKTIARTSGRRTRKYNLIYSIVYTYNTQFTYNLICFVNAYGGSIKY